MSGLVSEGVVFAVAVVTAGVTLLVGLVTVGVATLYHRRDTKRAAVRDRTRGQLLERLFGQDPEWERWVDGLSGSERRQVRVLLEGYLRQLRGTEHDRLCSLARALGIQTEARHNLERGRARFRALTWLALLDEGVSVDRLTEWCTDTSRNRAGAARVLHESGHPEAPRVGTDLLVGDGEESLSAFGLDTLYRLNDGGETPLLARLPEATETWAAPVIVQALLALRYASVDTRDGRIAWLVDLLSHESARIRAAALAVVERHGWRESLRRQVDVDRLVTDPDPSVRSDAYLLLASWGDERSAAQLQSCLDSAFDTQLLAVVRALSVHPRAGLPEPTERTRPVVDWVRAEAAVTGHSGPVWGVRAAWV